MENCHMYKMEPIFKWRMTVEKWYCIECQCRLVPGDCS